MVQEVQQQPIQQPQFTSNYQGPIYKAKIFRETGNKVTQYEESIATMAYLVATGYSENTDLNPFYNKIKLPTDIIDQNTGLCKWTKHKIWKNEKGNLCVEINQDFFDFLDDCHYRENLTVSKKEFNDFAYDYIIGLRNR